MQVAKANPFVSPSLLEAVQTDVDTQSPMTREQGPEDRSRASWQNLIDHKLIEWGRDPGQFDDEGVEAPTRETIRLAIVWAQALRDAGFAPPDNVVPDPNGGIVFERREKEVSEVFHIWDDGSVDYCYFRGTRLVERRTL